MIADVFLNDYFEHVLDEHELNETLIKWLISNGVFTSPINSIEDAEVTDIEVIQSGYTIENGQLTIQAKYTAKIACFYVDRNEQDRSFSALFELVVKCILAETKVVSDNGDLTITYKIKDAWPAVEIEMLHCK